MLYEVYLDKDIVFFELGIMVKRFVILPLLAVVLFGCTYSVYSNAYPHLKKIRVEAFDNQSAEFGIAETVYTQLINEFRQDGRLRPVTQQPDCVISGTVSSFEEKIYSYDTANAVQDYQVRLTLSISFTDLIRNEAIYENKALTLTQTYAVAPGSTSRFKSKEEAIDELITTLFQTIVQNSLERW